MTQILKIIAFINRNRKEHETFLKNKTAEKSSVYKKKVTVEVYEALDSLEKVMAENDSCPNLAFYIGYLKLSIGLQNEAVENFAMAIDKCDDNHSDHFIWKGIALCMCDSYEEALNEFRIALNLKPTYFTAALFKGKCYLYKSEFERAMFAFKDFLEGKPDEEHEIKYNIGNFFFANGAIGHARQSYEEALELSQKEKTIRELVKIYILEKNLYLAMTQLEILTYEYSDTSYAFDIKVLNSLKSAASSGDYSEAIEYVVTLTEHHYGFVFSLVDVYFYRGVYNFYLGKYDEAIQLFEQAGLKKYGSSVLPDNLEYEEKYLECLQAEAKDEQTCSNSETFVRYELDYNIALCYIMKNDLSEAIKWLKKLLQWIPNIKAIDSFIRALEGESPQNNGSNSAESNAESLKDQSPQLDDLEYNVPLTFAPTIFPYKNRLCGIFEEFSTEIVQLNTSKKLSLTAQLSFCLPSVPLPDTRVIVGLEILDSLTIQSVENKPEAPWINRTDKGLIFTTNLISTEATEIHSKADLLSKLPSTSNAPLHRSTVKNTIDKIFVDFDNKLKTLKHQLMLDPKINNILDKITKK